MKKNILLIIDGVITFHDSTEEAMTHSQERKYDNAKLAHIYAYHSTAVKGGFRWEDDKPKAKVKRADGKRNYKRWSTDEDKILTQAMKDGKTFEDVAQVLYRTPKSVELRWYKVKVTHE